jgi:hypothetical protein
MGNDVKQEFSVSPAIHLLSSRRAPERKPAEHKWPGIEGKFLMTIGSLFADQADRVELLDLMFG